MQNIPNSHYDEEYFSWQMSIGDFGGWADKNKFAKYIKSEDVVLDFGCGGGFLLKNFKCKKKIGIEVNPSAMQCAKKNGIEVFTSAEMIQDEFIDVIVSNNALEHTKYPLKVLKVLYRKLKLGGVIIFIVPCEAVSCKYKSNDINHHLYSWSPMCAGNLFSEAGFSIVESKAYKKKWPPMYNLIATLAGRKVFELASSLYGRISLSFSQVRIIAEKK